MLPILSAALPVLASVTVCTALDVPTGTLEKLRLAGVSVTPADGVTPVPVSPTLWGLPIAPSVIVTVPLRLPDAVGVNVALMTQLDPADKLAGQLLV